MEIENYTKEPKLEEYGLDVYSYENFSNQKKDLEKELFQFKDKKYYNSIVGNILVFGGLILGFVFQSWMIFFAGLIAGTTAAVIEEDLRSNKDKEIEEERKKEIKEKLDLVKNRLFPFEQASVKYYENYLEQFFQNNLYKKHSGSKEFEQSLSKFSSMIDEVEEINKKLVLKHNNLSPYKSYLEGRQINHEYQKNNKLFFNSFKDVKNNLNNKELTQKQEEIIKEPELGINKKTKEDFKNKRDLEIVEKEAKKLISPEKRYRIARKIDNWEEINKKRKETGNKGEEIVFVLEQEYFLSINREDLSEKVRHVSVEDGDGLGYDILSFFDDGREKYIEVKSTTVSIESPFNISKNELEFLQDHYEDAFIYRVSVASEPPEVKVRPSFEILESDIIPVSYIVKNK